MDGIAGRTSALNWIVQISVVALVALWAVPDLGPAGVVVSHSGPDFWVRLVGGADGQRQNLTLRTANPGDDGAQMLVDGVYSVQGQLFGEGSEAQISTWGTSSLRISEFAAGDTADLSDGETLTVQADGAYVWSSPTEMTGRGQRIFVTATTPPEFTLQNYDRVLFSGDSTDGMTRAFLNTLTVTIPATIIPIVIAAFAAYALAWMDFPGRALLIAAVVGLLVVPLQLALIPLLRLHLEIGIRQRLSGDLAGAYRVRAAAGHISLAQLHGRSAA